MVKERGLPSGQMDVCVLHHCVVLTSPCHLVVNINPPKYTHTANSKAQHTQSHVSPQNMHWKRPDSWRQTQLLVQTEENWSGDVNAVDTEGKNHVICSHSKPTDEKCENSPKTTALKSAPQIVVWRVGFSFSYFNMVVFFEIKSSF